MNEECQESYIYEVHLYEHIHANTFTTDFLIV
jgi:hypothetical protein